jgi:hypothetical protein
LLVRYLTQRIVGLFNTPLRFFCRRTTREESEQN